MTSGKFGILALMLLAPAASASVAKNVDGRSERRGLLLMLLGFILWGASYVADGTPATPDMPAFVRWAPYPGPILMVLGAVIVSVDMLRSLLSRRSARDEVR
jgi:hypothetical protein